MEEETIELYVQYNSMRDDRAMGHGNATSAVSGCIR